jgi:hypothetical protein
LVSYPSVRLPASRIRTGAAVCGNPKPEDGATQLCSQSPVRDTPLPVLLRHGLRGLRPHGDYRRPVCSRPSGSGGRGSSPALPGTDPGAGSQPIVPLAVSGCRGLRAPAAPSVGPLPRGPTASGTADCVESCGPRRRPARSKTRRRSFSQLERVAEHRWTRSTALHASDGGGDFGGPRYRSSCQAEDTWAGLYGPRSQTGVDLHQPPERRADAATMKNVAIDRAAKVGADGLALTSCSSDDRLVSHGRPAPSSQGAASWWHRSRRRPGPRRAGKWRRSRPAVCRRRSPLPTTPGPPAQASRRRTRP